MNSKKEYIVNLLREDSSILKHYEAFIGNKSYDNLTDDDIDKIMPYFSVKLYDSEAAEKLAKKGILNVGLCPNCGDQFKNKDLFWIFPNSTTKLYLCEKCWTDEQRKIRDALRKGSERIGLNKDFFDDPYTENINRIQKAKKYRIIFKIIEFITIIIGLLLIIGFVFAIFGWTRWAYVGILLPIFIFFLVYHRKAFQI